jgi:hypothetical protein
MVTQLTYFFCYHHSAAVRLVAALRPTEDFFTAGKSHHGQKWLILRRSPYPVPLHREFRFVR